MIASGGPSERYVDYIIRLREDPGNAAVTRRAQGALRGIEKEAEQAGQAAGKRYSAAFDREVAYTDTLSKSQRSALGRRAAAAERLAASRAARTAASRATGANVGSAVGGALGAGGAYYGEAIGGAVGGFGMTALAGTAAVIGGGLGLNAIRERITGADQQEGSQTDWVIRNVYQRGGKLASDYLPDSSWTRLGVWGLGSIVTGGLGGNAFSSWYDAEVSRRQTDDMTRRSEATIAAREQDRLMRDRDMASANALRDQQLSRMMRAPLWMDPNDDTARMNYLGRNAGLAAGELANARSALSSATVGPERDQALNRYSTALERATKATEKFGEGALAVVDRLQKSVGSYQSFGAGLLTNPGEQRRVLSNVEQFMRDPASVSARRLSDLQRIGDQLGGRFDQATDNEVNRRMGGFNQRLADLTGESVEWDKAQRLISNKTRVELPGGRLDINVSSSSQAFNDLRQALSVAMSKSQETTLRALENALVSSIEKSTATGAALVRDIERSINVKIDNLQRNIEGARVRQALEGGRR